MHFLSAITGLAVGTVIWFILSYFIAHSIAWTETRYPQLIGSKEIRVGEIAACAMVFFFCLGLSFWITHLLWLQIK